ncbi:L-lactate utilization protein LutB, partial [Desulfitispora alkaliphila]|uniref:hypothetical protein n=1 Tax=Desulfitispora alkaliphila TaxID=622674 RepID=UPI003D239AC7
MSKDFKQGVNKALENKNLTGALDRFQRAYTISRENAYYGLDIEALRDKVSSRKAYAADRMEELTNKFKT